VRNIGSTGYCATHLGELYATFDPAAFALHGVGLQVGPARPEWGPTFADLQCIACDATWTGPIGEPCPWCHRERLQRLAWAAEGVLRPPADLDPARADFDDRIRAWARRLRAHVDEGVIDAADAERALQRAVNRAA
jgi:hypothetical protein